MHAHTCSCYLAATLCHCASSASVQNAMQWFTVTKQCTVMHCSCIYVAEQSVYSLHCRCSNIAKHTSLIFWSKFDVESNFPNMLVKGYLPFPLQSFPELFSATSSTSVGGVKYPAHHSALLNITLSTEILSSGALESAT